MVHSVSEGKWPLLAKNALFQTACRYCRMWKHTGAIQGRFVTGTDLKCMLLSFYYKYKNKHNGDAMRCDVMWCDVMWRDVTWRDAMRCDVMWRNVTWRDAMWRDVTWRDVMWCDVTWRDVMRCDVMWCDVMWRNVTWRDAMWRDVTWRDWRDVTWRDVMWCDVMWCDVMWCDDNGLLYSYKQSISAVTCDIISLKGRLCHVFLSPNKFASEPTYPCHECV